MGKNEWNKGVDKSVYEMTKGGKVNNYNNNSKGGHRDDSLFWLGAVIAFIAVCVIGKFL